MRCYVLFCALSVLAAVAWAAPMPQSNQESSTAVSMGTQTQQIVNGINSKIMLLRRFCPQLFQVIDNVIQNVTSVAFRVIGRAVLQSGGLGGGGGGGGTSGGGESRVSVVLPTFGPDDDDYDDEDDDESSNSISGGSSSSSSTEASSSSSSALQLSSGTSNSNNSFSGVEAEFGVKVEDIRLPTSLDDKTDDDDGKPLFTSPASTSSSSRNKRETDFVRTIRAAAEQAAVQDDQEAAASGGNGPNPSDDLGNVEIDDADRDKRYLPGGEGGFGASASIGTSGGGSGNFLFDIIRRTADGAARAAGTVYRMIAGTESLGLGLTATSTSSRLLPSQLIAGSGATEESDEKDNAPLGAGGVAEIDVAKSADGYTEGIPGPITRLFVLANRGLANLVQDLILRLAQTSERIVNFKARLITALI